MAVLALMIVLLPVMSQAGTWKKNSTGWWWQEDNGSWPANQWKYIHGTWYAFDGNGYMRTGWYWDGRFWYYLTGSGAMAEGWASVGGTWYYLQPGSGAMAEGWKQIGGTWYYLQPGSGAMAEGWASVGGTWYYLQPGNGAMQTGWVKDGTTWYYINSSGAMLTGWQLINGSWYYLYGNGKMAENTWIGSCYVNPSGAWIPDAVQSQWIRSGDRWWYRHSDGSYTVNGWETINQKKYHFDKNGWMQTGWQKINESWYYLGPVGDGAMRKNQWVDDSYLGSDGKMMTACWVDDYYVGISGKITKNQWVQDYYAGADGKKLKNQWIDDSYVGGDGKKVTSQWIGESYVDEDGVLVRNQWVGDSFVGKNGTKLKNTWIGDRYLDSDGNWDRTKPVRVPLETIRLQTTGQPLKPGEEEEIDWQYYPENTTDDLTAKWTSSDESIATVKDGKVTAHKAGVVKIALKVSDVSRSVEMLVLPEDASSISVEIKYPTSDADYLKYGEAAEVSVHMQPGNYDITNLIRMSVDDENILMLNSPVGTLWATDIGETTLHITIRDIELSRQIKVVSADKDLEELYFDQTTLYMEKNETTHLRLTSKPVEYANYQYANGYGIRWGSSDESVVTADRFGIVAQKPGRATVYAEILGKRAECEVIVTGEEDVVEYSYDTEYAKYLFDEVNKMRTAHGIEPFVWNEEDAVYASKVKVGMHVQPDFDIYGITGVDENKETQDVQLVYGDDKDFTKEAALDALIQNSSCMIQLMKKTDQPLTAGCAVLVLKVDGKIEKRGLIFTIGPSESELANYSQQEREVYWANWMGISVDDMKKYLH